MYEATGGLLNRQQSVCSNHLNCAGAASSTPCICVRHSLWQATHGCDLIEHLWQQIHTRADIAAMCTLRSCSLIPVMSSSCRRLLMDACGSRHSIAAQLPTCCRQVTESSSRHAACALWQTAPTAPSHCSASVAATSPANYMVLCPSCWCPWCLIWTLLQLLLLLQERRSPP